jgi:hypothetical protein
MSGVALLIRLARFRRACKRLGVYYVPSELRRIAEKQYNWKFD